MSTSFYKGKENILPSNETPAIEFSDNSKPSKIKEAFLKVLDNKNLSFLLGSGCSSCEIKQTKEDIYQQIGIPVMAPLAKEFCGLI